MAEMYLAKPEDLGTLVKLPASDPRVVLALKRASNRFRGAVHYPVHKVVDDSIVLDGDGTPALHLPAAPVTALTVTVGGRLLTPGVDYQLNRKNGVLRRIGGVWPDALESVAVVYTHGWDTIPGDIEDAVLEQASVQAKQLINVQQESAGSTSVTYGALATVGVTAKWSEAVAKHSLGSGDRS